MPIGLGFCFVANEFPANESPGDEFAGTASIAVDFGKPVVLVWNYTGKEVVE